MRGIEGFYKVPFPACQYEELVAFLKLSHFFLFPTHEYGEGHSNSLTEAMSYGVVPVASDWGYNKSVVGDDNLIVDGYDARMYSDIIKKYWMKVCLKDFHKMFTTV